LIIFLNSEYSKNILEACAANNPCKDLNDYVLRVKAISSLNDEKLLENANRVLRILKDDVKTEIKENLFVEQAEKDLFATVKGVIFTGDYNKYLSDLISINPVVTKFFDDVLVMDKDENIKNNRLALLNSLKNKYVILTDFSKL
jgi:glycyl-tRNA synthetase beta chain